MLPDASPKYSSTAVIEALFALEFGDALFFGLSTAARCFACLFKLSETRSSDVLSAISESSKEAFDGASKACSGWLVSSAA